MGDRTDAADRLDLAELARSWDAAAEEIDAAVVSSDLPADFAQRARGCLDGHARAARAAAEALRRYSDALGAADVLPWSS
ncbi:hypothetical protein [Tsukamurella soli]|uniref:Uncharacterized protein n=1 Tax=Tsukamurella soli TaxID=644556 RepID=A0ABP8JNG9_9ACTN